MSVVFFEGFNYNNSDLIKLDPKYWSFNNAVSFGGGRTGNSVYLTGRPSASGLSSNSTLTLSNFTDPLSVASGLGVGFSLGNRSIVTNRTDTSSPPYNENLISFYDNSNTEVLRLDIIKTSGVTYGDSLGIGVYQNSTLVDVYDFKSHIGYAWSIAVNQTAGRSLLNNYNTFLEFYIDAKNQQKISIKFTASSTIDAPLRNNNNQFETSISGFNSLQSIKFYSRNDFDGDTNMDDLYISAGNSASEALLGSDARIYRTTLNGDYSTTQWSNAGGYSYQYDTLNTNDGDASYIYSSASGDISIFELSNLSNTPNNVAGIKIDNISRSSFPGSGWRMKNVLSDGTSIVEDIKLYELDSTTYSNNDSFIFSNPITGSGWVLSDINSLKVGVKNLGPYTP